MNSDYSESVSLFTSFHIPNYGKIAIIAII